jgi:hypothetical protein
MSTTLACKRLVMLDLFFFSPDACSPYLASAIIATGLGR